MCTRESESERRNNDFFRFAERAQTDFGVGAVINWAREADLGPEVFSSFKSEKSFAPGPFHIRRCGRGDVP